MEAIEADAQKLRSGKVSVENLHKHFSDYFKDKNKGKNYWWFNKYWLFPDLVDLEENWGDNFSFHQLSKGDEENAKKQKREIKKLLEAFRQIELVSIILRFIRPESFGILSPPVASILCLCSGGDATETYWNYLCDLRKIRKEYGFSTAAEADKALWVLKHKCNSKEPKDQSIKKEFEKDKFMLQLRAKNLAGPLNILSHTQLATALCEVNNHLATLVGSYALEENVQKFANEQDAKEEAIRLAKNKGDKYPTLVHYLDALKNKEKITPLEHGRWIRLQKKIRNKIFHADIENIVQRDVRELVDIVSDIEGRLSNSIDQ